MGRFQTTYPRPLRSNYAKYIARHGVEKWLWGNYQIRFSRRTRSFNPTRE